MKICLTCEGVTQESAARCAHCGGPLLDTDAVHFPERRGDGDTRNPLVGRVIDGKYRVLGVLGRGGMGTVYRAVHEVSLVQVALKVLHPRYSAHEEFRAWFLAEARKAGRVVHENSARIMDVGVARDGMVYIAVEYVDGVTFAEWTNRGPVAPAAVVNLLVQVARALSAAHAAGVVHRDLSPRNVMVTVRDGRAMAKILDFGIALGPPPGAGELDVADSAPSGFANPPYSAPEHLEGGIVDGRTDLYSLGVIAYEALTGELPVAGSTARELARATIEGRVRALRGRLGLPKALVRLVGRLLSRDPDDRPSSADEVVARLERVLEPPRAVLSVAAITALVGATAAFAIVHASSPRDEAFLRARGDPRSLVLSRSPPSVETSQALRSNDLLATRFDFGGFVVGDLRLQVSRGLDRLVTIGLGARMRETDGVARFTAEAAPLVAELASLSAAGAVDLTFAVEGLPPLGYARVRIDDKAPQITFDVSGDAAEGRSLRGSDLIAVVVEDRDAVLTVVLSVVLAGEPGRRREVPITERTQVASAADLLAAEFPGARSYGAATLQVVAADRAGNVGQSQRLEFTDLDLAVPSIEVVTGPSSSRVVVEDPAGTTLRLKLSEAEPDLEVSVRPPGAGDPIVVAARAFGDRLDIVLPSGPVGGVLPSGRWAFQVRDRAGNVGGWFEEELEFRTADPGAELELPDTGPEDDPRAVARIGGQLVGTGEPARIELRFNPVYRVERARLGVVGGDAVDGAVAIGDAREGRATVRLGALPPGGYELSVRLVEPRTERFVDLPPWRLTVLPQRVTLQLPDVGGVVHLPQLEERSALRVVADGSVQQGAAWRLDPADARLVRGRIWTSIGGRPVARESIEPTEADAPLLLGCPLGRGWHVVAVDLRDVLGRPVEVRRGDALAPECALPDGTVGREILRFYHHDQPVQWTDQELFVEFGQELRFELRTALPPGDDEAVRVRVIGSELSPVQVSRSPVGGSRLTFVVPFERARVAADLASYSEADFARGLTAELPIQVVTPIAEIPIRLALRTIRSTLRAVTLGDVSTRPLPGALASIRLVPVTSPGPGGSWEDPVPVGLLERRRIRAAPAIALRNAEDFFVQDRETTRAQYVEIVRAGLARVGALGAAVDWRDLVHAADPLGRERLTERAMVPTFLDADPRRFVDAVAAAPDRPVSGVDAFQAHTAVALLGLVIREDPATFRLPLGAELEMAALRPREGPTSPPVLNGAASRGRGLDPGVLVALGRHAGDLALWPPDAAELERSGDVVRTDLGDRVTGLDAGLREWVLDLPFLLGSAQSSALLQEWLADQPRHVERAQAFARPDQRGGDADELRAFAETYGVVRGAAVVPHADYEVFQTAAIPAGWPGVVRVLQLRRDGVGLLPGRHEPNLESCGFRFAGGRRFVAEVRSRW